MSPSLSNLLNLHRANLLMNVGINRTRRNVNFEFRLLDYNLFQTSYLLQVKCKILRIFSLNQNKILTVFRFYHQLSWGCKMVSKQSQKEHDKNYFHFKINEKEESFILNYLILRGLVLVIIIKTLCSYLLMFKSWFYFLRRVKWICFHKLINLIKKSFLISFSNFNLH